MFAGIYVKIGSDKSVSWAHKKMRPQNYKQACVKV